MTKERSDLLDEIAVVVDDLLAAIRELEAMVDKRLYAWQRQFADWLYDVGRRIKAADSRDPNWQ